MPSRGLRLRGARRTACWRTCLASRDFIVNGSRNDVNPSNGSYPLKSWSSIHLSNRSRLSPIDEYGMFLVRCLARQADRHPGIMTRG